MKSSIIENDHSLVTGGESDPFLPQLLDAINQATEIEFAVAFIRQSGLKLIFDALKDAVDRKATVRILTSDYMGVTDPKALQFLMLLAEHEHGADVRLFSTNGDPSFHIKSYIFLRRKEETLLCGCAFVGSSNLSEMALTRGLEWNLRVDYPADSVKFHEILTKFEALFTDPKVFSLSHAWIDSYAARRKVSPPIVSGEPEETLLAIPTEIQIEALAALQTTRELGYQRGLVVLATGLGKTWLAAFDVLQIRANRVLFVAHREEILMQAEETFIRIQPEASIGKYTGKKKDTNADFIFASIQTLGRDEHLKNFEPNCFDYIVVDEFHHADSVTYRRLINYFQPGFMLGLTATPERTDQADILSLCDDNLVFEKNFVEGINANLLCPFRYYGIYDKTVDYHEIGWRNRRFDPSDLMSKLATLARAKHVLSEWRKLGQHRTLAFCISHSHADFMATYFSNAGIRAKAVHSKSACRRNVALTQLKTGEIEVIFSVDLFNEGVDLPAIDTIMMLRPTESKILFLQQLGRGLRLHLTKKFVCVLDFIGNHDAFLNKPESLFGVRSLREFIAKQQTDTLPLPKGCFVNYELSVINFLEAEAKKLAERIKTKKSTKGIIETYELLKTVEQRRPSAVEMYHSGIGIGTNKKNNYSWFDLVAECGDLDNTQQIVLELHRSFFLETETGVMSRSYKMILLEALLELDGFNIAQTTKDLAIRSGEILLRRPKLMANDLPKDFQNLAEILSTKFGQWRAHWMNYPIKALIGGFKQEKEAFFVLESDRLKPTFTLAPENRDIFHTMLQELVDYKLAWYMSRTINAKTKTPTAQNIPVKFHEDWESVPYYQNLKIACGHFKNADGENEAQVKIPPHYRADPQRHFIARASGNSMDGGRNPIRDGDFLLLEFIDADHAGSISNQIMAVERQDASGDDQYILRVVRKRGEGDYYLQANNPEFSDFDASDEMRTFARFREILSPEEVLE